MADDAIRYERRMSDMDALMWNIEKDPLLRSTITAVAILDQAPDHDRLMDKVERATRQIPRLRQKAVTPPLGLAPPQWIVDPNFDLAYHVRFVKAPGNGTLRALLDFAAPISMQSFDRARPLWEFYVVEGLEDGRAALIQKIHHSVTDGVGGIKIALMLLEAQREATDLGPMPEAPEAERPSITDLLREAVEHENRRRAGIAQRSLAALPSVVRDAASVAQGTGETVASLARLLAPATKPLSPLMTARSLSVRFETLTAPLGELKAAAKKAEGKLNDAFVAAVAGGLGRYHERHGHSRVEGLRMTMPINIRSGDNDLLAGNQFVPARFAVPLSITDPLERMRAIKGLVGEARAEPALALTEPIAGVLNRLPTTMTTALFGSMLKGVDFVTSNVPGVPFQLYLAGARLEANYAFGPLTGSAMNLTLLSYIDDLHIGVNVDPAAVPDVDVLVECLTEGFDEIVKLAG